MELKITGTLMLELADYMQAIESIAGHVMLPSPEGWYVVGQCEPVLRRDHQYFYVGDHIDNVAQAIPVDFNQLALADIHNSRGDLVVTKRQIPHLTRFATHSLRAKNLIVEIIDHLLQSHARWTGSQQSPKIGPRQSNLHGVIRPFLLEPFQRSGITIEGAMPEFRRDWAGNEKRSKHRRVVILDPVDDEGRPRITEQDKQFFYMGIEICDAILLQINDLLVQLMDFLGTDRWIMHFMKTSNTQVSVEKTLDYRIYSWMMEHGREYDD
jgi:hypothetical protein